MPDTSDRFRKAVSTSTVVGAIIGGFGLAALTVWLWSVFAGRPEPASPIILGLAFAKGLILGAGSGRSIALAMLRRHKSAGGVAAAFAVIGALWIAFILYVWYTTDGWYDWRLFLMMEGPTLLWIVLLALSAKRLLSTARNLVTRSDSDVEAEG